MANSLNKVQIIGNITKDLELKSTKGGHNVCVVDIATNEGYKDNNDEWQERPNYHTVVLWGNLAEVAVKYLGKGDKVYFEGSLQTRSWEAEDGTKRYKTEIKAKEMIMLGSKKKSEEGRGMTVEEIEDGLNDIAKPKGSKKVSQDPEIDDLPF